MQANVTRASAMLRRFASTRRDKRSTCEYDSAGQKMNRRKKLHGLLQAIASLRDQGQLRNTITQDYVF